MGQLRKKIGLKISSIISNWLLIIFFALLAASVQYMIFLKKITEDVVNYSQYSVYFFVVVAVAMLIAFYVKFTINIPISLYEEEKSFNYV